ncbi:CPBP family intramembrane glutamic endopeptidase [Spirillospora sp. NPDC127200]
MTSTHSPRTPAATSVTCAGAAIFVLAYAWPAITGNTQVARSSDPDAAVSSLWAAALPPLAAIVLARLFAPASEGASPLADLPASRLRRETWVLVTAAVLLALVAPQAQGGLYPLVKVLFLLVVPLVALRVIGRGGPKAKAVPAPVVWLAPLPAVLAWFLLSHVGPLAVPLTQDLPDPVTLVVGSLITLLTASVLEEVFYRGWLQTRLEALYGRWPAIMVSALLFALMHSSRINGDDPLAGLATIIAFQGVFGLMLGYLWSRYRNFWIIVFIHVVSNLVLVPLLIERL